MKLLRSLVALAAFLGIFSSANAELKLVKATPESGSKVEELSTIQTVWNCDFFDDSKDTDCGKVVDAAGNIVSNVDCEIDFLDPYCEFILRTPISEPGTYTVTIFAQTLLSDEDEWNEEFTLTYRIGEEEEPVDPVKVVSVDPMEETSLISLETIAVKWSAPVERINLDLSVTVCDENQALIGEMKAAKSEDADDTIILTATSSIEAKGKVAVNIPEGIIEASDGALSEKVTLIYSLDNLSTIISVEDKVLFDVMGQYIRNNTYSPLVVMTVDGRIVSHISEGKSGILNSGIYLIKVLSSPHKVYKLLIK